MKKELASICLNGGSEKEIIECIKKIPDYPLVIKNLGPLQDGLKKIPLLYFAAQNNFLELARLLINEGIPKEELYICTSLSETKESHLLHRTTALGVACFNNHHQMVQLLVDSNAELLNRHAPALLSLTERIEVVQILVAAARKKNQLIPLLLARINAFQWYLRKGNTVILSYLIQLNEFDRYTDLVTLLHEARQVSWQLLDKAEELNTICLQLRKRIELSRQSEGEYIEQMDEKDFYFRLFTPPKPGNTSDKKETVALVIAQFYELLSSPEQCIPYLKFLSDELNNYFKQKHGQDFPKLNQEHYQFVSINSTEFPIPKNEYKGINKSHALQELLMAIFRKYDANLAQQAYKWIGFIPSKEANSLVLNGFFLTENRVAGNLLHGKLSHMIQQLLLIYAIQDGRINLRNGINMKDILDGLVNMHSKRFYALWSEVRDYRHSAKMVFYDPYNLNSFIMKHREYFPELSDSLTDTFCRGFLYYKKTHQDVIINREINTDEFVRQLNDVKLHQFFGTSKLIQHEKMRDKNKLNILSQGAEYAVVSKEYNPLDTFTPKIYQVPQIGHC